MKNEYLFILFASLGNLLTFLACKIQIENTKKERSCTLGAESGFSWQQFEKEKRDTHKPIQTPYGARGAMVGIGMSTNWHISILVHWYIGMLACIHWYIDILICVSKRVFLCLFVVYHYISILVYQHISILVCLSEFDKVSLYPCIVTCILRDQYVSMSACLHIIYG